jgi:hypothetical protein
LKLSYYLMLSLSLQINTHITPFFDEPSALLQEKYRRIGWHEWWPISDSTKSTNGINLTNDKKSRPLAQKAMVDSIVGLWIGWPNFDSDGAGHFPCDWYEILSMFIRTVLLLCHVQKLSVPCVGEGNQYW